MDTEKSNGDWSEVEIQAAVDAYLSMLSREQNGQAINKAHENRVLREGVLAGRTKGSVEFRMQNISTVLVELGRDRIVGYKPAKNVGANVTKSIREALNAPGPLTPEDFAPTADEATLEQRAAKLERQPIKVVPKGIEKPQQTQSSGKSYVRDPEVRAWVRQQAEGKCEGCGQPAPFEKSGNPFLEVHHVKHLAQEGSDRPSNAVALCPNCHRRCHHSSDRDEFTALLYAKVKRLKPE
ncbi:5-methylcytosine-specific restriction enzyme A [Pseudomonas reinekei]|jgi:5-methylcytosine-specific restriction protein A|uniref:5-methylcytosine-specific restriction enzyme A n=1 Tax=Pseudomonas reinekei TaxID=395598 RepID=A0A1H0SAP6_PSERE|nr:HNH endonuclease [Pseudomonas reinekei]KAB0487193.1 HNH endonuclease [Pseudomonas reinekei]OLU04598.1 HNH endonuclease [Pseudomonas reinekei]SDP38824.1 5-methylcytosine-specific restriction enzyme A [Pseudomonas reinekei]